jgi:hypothetical protein
MNEKYQADVIIQSEWIGDSDISVYDPKIHWNPELSIENQLSVTKESISYSVTEKPGVNVIRETRQVKGNYHESIYSL